MLYKSVHLILRMVVDYGGANVAKPLHIGHLRSAVIGESVKTIDKLSEGELFSLYPVIPWKEIMKLRDVIAHHYLKIDVDIVYSTMKEDLPLLQATLLSMKQAILS